MSNWHFISLLWQNTSFVMWGKWKINIKTLKLTIMSTSSNKGLLGFIIKSPSFFEKTTLVKFITQSCNPKPLKCQTLHLRWRSDKLMGGQLVGSKKTQTELITAQLVVIRELEPPNEKYFFSVHPSSIHPSIHHGAPMALGSLGGCRGLYGPLFGLVTHHRQWIIELNIFDNMKKPKYPILLHLHLILSFFNSET